MARSGNCEGCGKWTTVLVRLTRRGWLCIDCRKKLREGRKRP